MTLMCWSVRENEGNLVMYFQFPEYNFAQKAAMINIRWRRRCNLRIIRSLSIYVCTTPSLYHFLARKHLKNPPRNLELNIEENCRQFVKFSLFYTKPNIFNLHPLVEYPWKILWHVVNLFMTEKSLFWPL